MGPHGRSSGPAPNAQSPILVTERRKREQTCAESIRSESSDSVPTFVELFLELFLAEVLLLRLPSGCTLSDGLRCVLPWPSTTVCCIDRSGPDFVHVDVRLVIDTRELTLTLDPTLPRETTLDRDATLDFECTLDRDPLLDTDTASSSGPAIARAQGMTCCVRSRWIEEADAVAVRFEGASEACEKASNVVSFLRPVLCIFVIGRSSLHTAHLCAT